MWFVNAIKWIFKLCMRIILFPIFLLMSTLTILLNILLHIGSFATGLLVLVMLYGIISQLLQHHWDQALLAFGMTAVGVGIFFCAGMVVDTLENVNTQLAGFIRG